jgi:hypothetical protein
LEILRVQKHVRFDVMQKSFRWFWMMREAVAEFELSEVPQKNDSQIIEMQRLAKKMEGGFWPME